MLCCSNFEFGFAQPGADFLHVADAELFGLPLFAEVGELGPQLLHLVLDLGEPILGVFFGLLGQLTGGQFELRQAALDFVDLAGHAFQFHGQAAHGLVHQVDGFVGQEAVGDVAVRKLGGGHQGRVLDLHALVVGFVARLETAEDGDRVVDAWFVDVDRLKAAFEGRVLFDVLAIFVERGGADATQLAAGQRRLEQVGRIAAALGRAGTDDGVQLVDEQNDAAAGGLDFAEHGLEPFFELAAKLGAGDQRAQVERDDALVLEALRHVALDDSQGQAFGDGRFADARLADQHGIVLRAAREDLNDAADFLIAADHRIELALLGALDQVDAVLFEGLELLFGILVGDAGAAAHGLQGFEHRLLVDGIQLENVLGLRVDLRQREQQVLGRDELVLHRVGLFLGGFEHLGRLLRRSAAWRRRWPWADVPARPR